jgi:hypothetical protein
MEESGAAGIRPALVEAGVQLESVGTCAEWPSIVCFSSISDELIGLLHEIRRSGIVVLALATSPAAFRAGVAWRLLHAGATDTLVWRSDGSAARQILARLDRWSAINELAANAALRIPLIGGVSPVSDPAFMSGIRRIFRS